MIHPKLASNDPQTVRILDVCALVAFSGSDPTRNQFIDDQDSRSNRSLKPQSAETLQFILASSIQSPIAR